MSWATLVRWYDTTMGSSDDDNLARFAAYGGSTVVAIFPKDSVQFDDDLLANSSKPIETLVKVRLHSRVLEDVNADSRNELRSASESASGSARDPPQQDGRL